MFSKQEQWINFGIVLAPGCYLYQPDKEELECISSLSKNIGETKGIKKIVPCGSSDLMSTLYNSNVTSIGSKCVITVGSKSSDLLWQLRTFIVPIDFNKLELVGSSRAKFWLKCSNFLHNLKCSSQWTYQQAPNWALRTAKTYKSVKRSFKVRNFELQKMNKNQQNKKIWRWEELEYIVNLKSFANTDGDKCLSPQTLNRERNAACYVPNCSIRFKNPHLFL